MLPGTASQEELGDCQVEGREEGGRVMNWYDKRISKLEDLLLKAAHDLWNEKEKVEYFEEMKDVLKEFIECDEPLYWTDDQEFQVEWDSPIQLAYKHAVAVYDKSEE
jgi:hypothetical protein